MKKHTDQYEDKKGMGAIVAGTLIAAGAAAVTYYLTKEENRKKVGDTIGTIKDKAKDQYSSLRGRTEESKEAMKSKAKNLNA